MRALIYRAWMKRPRIICGQVVWHLRYQEQRVREMDAQVKGMTEEVVLTRAMMAAMGGDRS